VSQAQLKCTWHGRSRIIDAPSANHREMTTVARKNAFYAQSGGVTAVINASACGVIETARANKRSIGKVFAGPQRHHRGPRGRPHRHHARERRRDRGLMQTPAGAFGSCRHKLKSLEDNRAEYERLIEVFSAHDIGYFFYNGGGDSADTCLKVSQLSERWAIRCRRSTSPRPSTTTCR
jgi:6-phosphofructokinase